MYAGRVLCAGEGKWHVRMQGTAAFLIACAWHEGIFFIIPAFNRTFLICIVYC